MQPPLSPPPGTPPAADTPTDDPPHEGGSHVPGTEAPPFAAPPAVSSETAPDSAADPALDATDTTDSFVLAEGEAGEAAVAEITPPGAVTTDAEVPLSPAPLVVHGPENASVVIPPFVANEIESPPAEDSLSVPDYAPGSMPDSIPEGLSPNAPPPEYAANGGSVSPAYPPTYPPPDFAPAAPPSPSAMAPENAPAIAPPVRAASPRVRAAGLAAATVGVCIASAALLAVLGFAAGQLADGGFSYAFLTLEGLRFWVPGLLLAALAGVLVWLVAGRRPTPGLPALTAGVFPFATMLAGLLFLSVYRDAPWLVLAPIATGVALIVGTGSRLLLRDPARTTHDIARTVLTISTYVVAFVTLAMVYINKLRSVQSATAVTLLCALLLLQMTDGEEVPMARRLVYAVAGGLIVGQVTWIINYWSATGWTGGAFLLAVFYLVAGLSAARLRGRIGLFDIVEFGGVAALALLIVSAAVLIQS